MIDSTKRTILIVGSRVGVKNLDTFLEYNRMQEIFEERDIYPKKQNFTNGDKLEMGVCFKDIFGTRSYKLFFADEEKCEAYLVLEHCYVLSKDCLNYLSIPSLWQRFLFWKSKRSIKKYLVGDPKTKFYLMYEQEIPVIG